jgi:hypothetical protein
VSATRDLPALPVMAAALRKTTERLAAEVVASSAQAPDWNELEWGIARSAAAMQGISALLANGLAWSGPPAWRAFLAEQREQSLLRDARIGAVLVAIDAAARGHGVACIALKGAALRSLELYRPGERPMADIDLLVARGDLAAVSAALTDVGYVEAFTTQRHRVFEPRGGAEARGVAEHVDNPLKIEVHTEISELLPVREVAITERLWPAKARSGLNQYPDLVAVLLHLLLHAAGNMRAHALRQIQLHDIALIANLLYDRDWRAVLEWRKDAAAAWWMFPPLALTARYYPKHIPLEVLELTRAACPRMLRFATARESLTDISWSNLRIHAFPGIAWSQTPLDVVRFVRSRVAPSRKALADLELARKAQPQLDQVPWYGASHGSRIARWLFSRPPRVQTIVSVRAALESVGVEATKAAD